MSENGYSSLERPRRRLAADVLEASAAVTIVALVVAAAASMLALLVEDQSLRSPEPLSFDFASPGASAPLILDLHGAGQTPSMQSAGSGMLQCAESRGWHIVYPSGVGNTWNAGPEMYAPAWPDADHVGNLSDMATSLRASLNASRVFVAGLSNGCAMALRLGLEADPGAIDAVACTGHAMHAEIRAREPPVPRPLLLLTGAHDPIFAGETAVERTLRAWMSNNGCPNGTRTNATTAEGVTTSDAAACGENAVRHVLYHHHGHIVPLEEASKLQCDFFAQHLTD